MSYVTSRKTAFLPLLALLGAASLAFPVYAQTTDKVAPGSPAGSPVPAAAARDYSTPERVEARISDLKAKLTITAAQEPQWNGVAETMRGNAQAMEQSSAKRTAALQTMTVMDDLKSYEGLATTHAEGLRKLVATFGPLYDSMSTEQKTAADTEFQGYRKRFANQK